MLRSGHGSSQAADSSSDSSQTDSSKIYDVMGIGFGPSNLALAIVVQEGWESSHGPRVESLFLEQKERFAWHPGLMLEGARVQLSFMKDLVTLRNPQSRFTFLSYLQDRGRLDEFANLRNFFPTRREFNDYYSWVAQQLDDQVAYGREVVSIQPVIGKGEDAVELLEVTCRHLGSGRLERRLTRNLVVATGGIPSTPQGIDIRASKRTFHTQDFLHRVPSDFPNRDANYRFLVVGSGQSAAEVFQYLYTNYPKAKVTAALRRFAYKPADDSHFVNEIFFPQMTDFLYELPEEKRQNVLKTHLDTNYSCVDLELIQEIYEEMYQNRIKGEDRVKIRPFLELRSLVDKDSGTMVHFHHRMKEEPVTIEADGVVLATGYDRPRQHPLLKELLPFLQSDDNGHLAVDRYYRVPGKPGFQPHVYLQGFCEPTHGLSDTLLSVLPSRCLEIYQTLVSDSASESVELNGLEKTAS